MAASKAVLKTLTGTKGNVIFQEIKNMKPPKAIKKATENEMADLARIFINSKRG